MAKLSIKIDPRQAGREAQRIKRDLREIGDEARRTEQRTDRLGRSANDNFRAIARGSGAASRGIAGMARAATAAIAVFAGFATATFSLRKFIDNTRTAQAVQQQLAATIQSTGGAAGQTLSSLNAHAASLQRITTIGDEVTNGAQALLLTFTKIQGDTFPQATKAVLDLSVALKKDLGQVALSVGRALNDPVRGVTQLRESGISFTTAQTEMIKQMVAANDVAGAQSLILAELERQFGGSAEAARGVFGGALEALGNSWGDVFELSKGATETFRLSIEDLIKAIESPAFVGFVQTIGTGLVGAFRLAVSGITILVDNFDTLARVATVVGASLLAAFGPSILLAIAGGFVSLARVVVASMNVIRLAMLTNPVGALLVALTAAGTAAFVFRDQIQEAIGVDVIGTMKDVANKIVGSFVGAYQSIIAVWGQLPAALGDLAFQAANTVIDAIESMINGAIARINTLIGSLQNLPFVGENFQGVGIGDVNLGDVGNPFEGSAAGVGQTIGSTFQRTLNTDYIGRLGEILSGTKSATDATVEMNNAIRAARESADDLGTASTGAGSAAAGGAKKAKDAWNGLQGATDAARESMNFVRDVAGGFFRDLQSGLRNGESFWESFRNAAVNAIDKVTDRLLDGLLNAIFRVNNAGGGGGGGGFFSSLLGGLFGGGGGFDPWAGLRFADGAAFRGGNVIPFARGGVVNRPTVFPMAKGMGLMGEAGPEAVMPLHRGSDGSLGVRAANNNGRTVAQNVNINVNVEGASGDPHVIDLVNQGVARGLQDYDRGTTERVAGAVYEGRSRAFIRR